MAEINPEEDIHTDKAPLLAGDVGKAPDFTLSTIQRVTGTQVSKMTINRRLRERNLRARRPLRCLPLTPVHRQVRLQWCRERSTWNCADWGRIVFSDESRFLLCPDDRRKRVWIRPGQRVDPGLTVEHHTCPQQGVMACGAISFDSRTPLVVIPGTLTAQRWRTIWQEIPQHTIRNLYQSMTRRVAACIQTKMTIKEGVLEVSVPVAVITLASATVATLLVSFSSPRQWPRDTARGKEIYLSGGSRRSLGGLQGRAAEGKHRSLELAYAQVSKIFSLRAIKNPSAKCLHEFMDVCNEAIRNLETLELKRNKLVDVILVHFLQQKLSENLRTYPVAISADIEKMYRQIRIHPEDADYQRILWRPSPEEPVVDYRLLTRQTAVKEVEDLEGLPVYHRAILKENGEWPEVTKAIQCSYPKVFVGDGTHLYLLIEDVESLDGPNVRSVLYQYRIPHKKWIWRKVNGFAPIVISKSIVYASHDKRVDSQYTAVALDLVFILGPADKEHETAEKYLSFTKTRRCELPKFGLLPESTYDLLRSWLRFPSNLNQGSAAGGSMFQP
ncbi:hypothetical protein LAZ67_11001621 [Cordylochernes scorpioides]|uniref:Transposase Tc1-like domain-containing protein n=1 Tax=Cordylochernes scorpioides TaxID=51811 RepID=A0ABY6L1Z7_9ARAC|nr:hypothetical protein LAZ67_11001621 [Cordylochernes scorpioides]